MLNIHHPTTCAAAVLALVSSFALTSGCVGASGGGGGAGTTAAADSGGGAVDVGDSVGSDSVGSDSVSSDSVSDDSASSGATGDSGATAPPVTVVISTSMGNITLELDAAKAPTTVANFVKYMAKKHYDGLLFQRVIKGFMIQGGGVTADGTQRKTDAPIKSEADNGLKNLRGTVAMARTGVIDSATSQFFINLVNNGFLDHKDKSAKGYGYAVFGKVTAGLDVVDKIGAVKTTGKTGDPPDKPLTDVVIKTVFKK